MQKDTTVKTMARMQYIKHRWEINMKHVAKPCDGERQSTE